MLRFVPAYQVVASFEAQGFGQGEKYNSDPCATPYTNDPVFIGSFGECCEFIRGTKGLSIKKSRGKALCNAFRENESREAAMP